MPNNFETELAALKEKLLLMASYAEAAVNRSVKALIRRDDALARRTKDEDSIIDRLEVEIDESALTLLEYRPTALDLRLVTMAMKIARNLERVGDEATTISRRCLELTAEPKLRATEEIPAMATLALALLKDSLDAFVNRDPARARAVIPRDADLDAQHRHVQNTLAQHMGSDTEAISRCLNLMVVAKSLERIGDHAKNVAEEVVYLYEGRDIRHTDQAVTPPIPIATAPKAS